MPGPSVLTSDIILGLITALRDQSAQGVPQLKPEDYQDVIKITITGAANNYAEFKDYCPNVFEYIRKTFLNLSTEEYMKSWHVPDKIELSESAGRSGSLFYRTPDRKFFFKTILHPEVGVMISVLSDYVAYLHHPDKKTFIMKVVGLHRLSYGKDHTWVLVFANSLPTNVHMDVHFDLKGRKPKPGKSLKERGRITPDKHPKKDNELDRGLVFLDEAQREHYIDQVKSDVDFLASHNLMDYSLLVGIHTVDESKQSNPEIHKPKVKAATENSDSTPLKSSSTSKKLKKSKDGDNEDEASPTEPEPMQDVLKKSKSGGLKKSKSSKPEETSQSDKQDGAADKQAASSETGLKSSRKSNMHLALESPDQKTASSAPQSSDVAKSTDPDDSKPPKKSKKNSNGSSSEADGSKSPDSHNPKSESKDPSDSEMLMKSDKIQAKVPESEPETSGKDKKQSALKNSNPDDEHDDSSEYQSAKEEGDEEEEQERLDESKAAPAKKEVDKPKHKSKSKHSKPDIAEIEAEAVHPDVAPANDEQPKHLEKIEDLLALGGFLGRNPLTDEREVYFIGIIDCLTSFVLKKKVAFMFKQFKWAKSTLSTVDAAYYGHRFGTFMTANLLTNGEISYKIVSHPDFPTPPESESAGDSQDPELAEAAPPSEKGSSNGKTKSKKKPIKVVEPAEAED